MSLVRSGEMKCVCVRRTRRGGAAEGSERGSGSSGSEDGASDSDASEFSSIKRLLSPKGPRSRKLSPSFDPSERDSRGFLAGLEIPAVVAPEVEPGAQVPPASIAVLSPQPV